jgi:hypothetical protein
MNIVKGRFPLAWYMSSTAGKPEFITPVISEIVNMLATMMGTQVKMPMSIVRFLRSGREQDCDQCPHGASTHITTGSLRPGACISSDIWIAESVPPKQYIALVTTSAHAVP